jgi:hypothetical protein
MSARALMRLWGTVIIGHTGALPTPCCCCSTSTMSARRSSWPATHRSLSAGYSSVGLGESHLWCEISQRRLCALRVTPRQWRYKTYGR